jgi:iron-sulfur cluster repair protein YtfE (RIC family)
MSSIDRADPVIMGHILAQHRELHAQLVAMRACLADPGRCVAATRQTLEHLRDHLRAHFCQEETGGFLEESIARMPRLSTAARTVMADHPALLAELDDLIATLEQADSVASWDRIAAAAERFTQHLLDHERNENAVVQEGYNEDLGLD